MPKTSADKKMLKKKARSASIPSRDLGQTAARSAAAKSTRSAAPARGRGTKFAAPEPKHQDTKPSTAGRAKAVEKKKVLLKTGNRGLTDSDTASSKRRGVEKSLAAEKRAMSAASASRKVAATKASGTDASSAKRKRADSSAKKKPDAVAVKRNTVSKVGKAGTKGALVKARANAGAAVKGAGATDSSRPVVERPAVKRAPSGRLMRDAVAPPRKTGELGEAPPNLDHDAAQQSESKTAVKRVPVELARPKHASTYGIEAVTAAAMAAPLIATATAMTAATIATTTVEAALASIDMGAKMLEAKHGSAFKPRATSEAEVSIKTENGKSDLPRK